MEGGRGASPQSRMQAPLLTCYVASFQEKVGHVILRDVNTVQNASYMKIKYLKQAKQKKAEKQRNRKRTKAKQQKGTEAGKAEKQEKQEKQRSRNPKIIPKPDPKKPKIISPPFTNIKKHPMALYTHIIIYPIFSIHENFDSDRMSLPFHNNKAESLQTLPAFVSFESANTLPSRSLTVMFAKRTACQSAPHPSF